MKKLVSLLLVLSLALFALPATAEESANEPITITAFQYELGNQEIDFPNLWFFQELEKKTNVHVDFQEVKDADWSTQLNLMFASGDYSDVIIRGTVDVEEYGVTQGLLVPLDDYLEKDMPNYYSRLYLNNANASIPASDGKSYYVGFLIAQNVNHMGTWYINTAWLDKLGLAVPTTVDELTEVLRAFKTQDPNGNGEADEIPFTADFDIENGTLVVESLLNQFAMFGVPENDLFVCIDDNNQVQFTGTMPGWRDCVAWLHTLYEEGLMDAETLTQDSNLWANKINAGQVGYFTYLRLINTALTPEAYADFTSILPPSADGYEARVSAILEVPEQGAEVTVTNPYIDRTLQWLDAQLETETMMTAANGILGDMFFLNDDGKYEISYVPENNGLYDIVPVICGQFFAPGEYYTQIYQMPPHRVERYEDSITYAEAGVLEPTSFQYLRDLSKMNADDSNEKALIYTELKKCMAESITDFVMNGITDESYQQFVDKCKSIGSERYVELYQNAYDAYLAKTAE